MLYEERREDLRKEYQTILKTIPKDNLIYLDESGFNIDMKREYGWKLKGERLNDNKSGKRRGKRITVISAYSNNTKKLIAPFYFQGNTDSIVFNTWIKQVLLPELKPNQIIIMDNAAFHKNKQTRELIESKQCRLLYLPPYSPDLNPIEHKWFHVKNHIKTIRNKFDSFIDALDNSLMTN